MNRHSRAARTASTENGGTRRAARLALLSLLALLALVFVPSAFAASQRPFKETFGSAAQPSFGRIPAIAVEQGSGDVLVADSEAGTVSRFHAVASVKGLRFSGFIVSKFRGQLGSVMTGLALNGR